MTGATPTRISALALALATLIGAPGCSSASHASGDDAAKDLGGMLPTDGGADRPPPGEPTAEGTDGPTETSAPAGDAGDASTGPDADPVNWGPPFLAVGYQSVRAVSLDGKSWTQASDPPLPPGWIGPPIYGDNQWLLRGGCWGQGKFLAVGGSGQMGLMLSSDSGQAWSLIGDGQSNDDCAFGRGRWVTQIRWSSDGVAFTKLPTGVSARRIVYGDGLFVAAGDNAISYTRDGERWTALPIAFAAAPPGRKGYNHIAFGNHRFLAVNTTIADAPLFEWDGAADTSFMETPHPPELAGAQTYDLTYGRHAFYLAGFGALYRRADGASPSTWEKIPGKGGATELYNLVVTDELFVDERWWSSDGAQWTPSTNAPPGITKIIATPR